MFVEPSVTVSEVAAWVVEGSLVGEGVWRGLVFRLGSDIITVWVVGVMDSWEVCAAATEGVGNTVPAHLFSALK